MNKFTGKIAHGGITYGPVRVINNNPVNCVAHLFDSVAEEIERLDEAIDYAREELDNLYVRASGSVGEELADIFNVHKLLLDDSGFYESIVQYIANHRVTAIEAVQIVKDERVTLFENIEDEYMKARGDDIADVAMLLIRMLEEVYFLYEGGEPECQIDDSDVSRFIIYADSIMPSQIINIGRERIKGIVTRQGSPFSHVAILARTINVPYLYSLDVIPDTISNEDMVLLDCINGYFVINPDNEQREAAGSISTRAEDGITGNPTVDCIRETVTRSNTHTEIWANISGVEDIPSALRGEASGIGLFRTEFVFMQKDHMPSEEEQFEIYKTAASMLEGRELVIRTVDIGSDKQIPYMNTAEYDADVTSLRGINFCLAHPDILLTQLKAIMRAAVYGNISVMYPMISSMDELEKIDSIINEAIRCLEDEQKEYKKVPQGVMIETLSAVAIADKLSHKAAFFSIGTNDLMQYVYSYDRENENSQDAEIDYDIILGMIGDVVEAAHQADIKVCVCGELAADPGMTQALLDCGIDRLSITF